MCWLWSVVSFFCVFFVGILGILGVLLNVGVLLEAKNRFINTDQSLQQSSVCRVQVQLESVFRVKGCLLVVECC